MPALPRTTDHDVLVELVYRGALESQPWQSALPALREALDAQLASITLRPPSEGDRGLIINCLRPEGDAPIASAYELADPNDWEVTAYREQFFTLDPFIDLPLGKVVALEDIQPDEELIASDYYQHYLKPIGLFRILGVDTSEPGGMSARLRFARQRSEERFSKKQRTLLQRIVPHLQLALEFYARLDRMTTERDLYAGAVDQLAVATVILDEQGAVLSTNAVARALLAEEDGISLKKNRMHISDRDLNLELEQSVQAVVKARQSGRTTVVRALRVPRSDGRSDLGLVIKPAPPSARGEGVSSPSIAVFISDPEQQDSASQQSLSELFGLTPAEANLALLLARGLNLAEASQTQNISQHTARAQLKSIFAKAGVSRQAELVRLVLKSAATLA